MTKYHQKLIEMRKLSRGTEYHTHLSWLCRVHEQQLIKESLK